MKQHQSADNSQGQLYIVPTPIGNLADITQRALEVLQAVDLIAAEDTRHTGLLLQHFGINARLFALHDHNEQQKAETLLAKLQEGQNIALVSRVYPLTVSVTKAFYLPNQKAAVMR